MSVITGANVTDRQGNYTKDVPTVKDVWTVSEGNYAPKFKIRAFILQKSGEASANVNLKFTDDDSADVMELATNVEHLGQVSMAYAANTDATSVIFLA
jgi:hypothetical protein